MHRLFVLAALSLLGSLTSPHARADAPKPFDWQDGDRVVLIGDDLIEREQKYGYLETLLTLDNRDKTITFRNLGWSGDTPEGIARARFGTQADGFKHLQEHVVALKPTVLIVGYGMTDSFAGAAGLPRFQQAMNHLLDTLAETRARLIIVSPIPHEDRGRPLPDPTAHNQSLALYRDELRSIAEQRQARFIDLLPAFPVTPPSEALAVTDDGIHLNDRGYRKLGFAIADNLDRIHRVGGRPEPVRLRQAIIEKNRLYFYRWRPQNETYLFGFRKHEQGNNAREVPLFDPLVAAKEEEIARLKQPEESK